MLKAKKKKNPKISKKQKTKKFYVHKDEYTKKTYPSVVLYVKTKQLEITNKVIARESITSV